MDNSFPGHQVRVDSTSSAMTSSVDGIGLIESRGLRLQDSNDNHSASVASSTTNTRGVEDDLLHHPTIMEAESRDNGGHSCAVLDPAAIKPSRQ